MERKVVQQILSEKTAAFFNTHKGCENDEREEAFRTGAAPRIGFTARVAASEDAVIERVGSEQARDADFVQGAQKTEVVEIFVEIFPYIGAEIVLEFEALRILMIGTVGVVAHRAFVGAVFVAQGDVTATAQTRNQKRSESEHGRKRCVSVQKSLLVELHI